jgi:hypothetical protein
MMATRFSDAQVASYIQNNNLSGAGLQQAAQVFQLPADQIQRAQALLSGNDPSIAAASQAYEAAVAGRPDLVEQNLSFYNAATGAGTGVTPEIIAAREAARVAEANRLAEEARTKTKTTTTASTVTMPKGYDQNFVNQLLREAAQQAGGTLSYADALAAAGRLGIPQNMLNTAMRTGSITESVTPFANATQGMQQNTRGNYTSIPIGVQSFDQNFQNYMNTPLGAQYNPGVTGGVSPYGAVMNQMQPFQNPYAGVLANQPIGGYNPNIYDAGLYDRVVQERADKAAADAAAATAQQTAMDYGGFDGGLITKVMGPKPDTPDDGTMFVQKGEYIVKKNAVNKYGKGLLDQINDGKIPAKKMKSLLG